MLFLKSLVQDSATCDITQRVLLSDNEEDSPLQLLVLTLFLPYEVASVTITILLTMSFSGKYAELFAR